jgi:MFS family permease
VSGREQARPPVLPVSALGLLTIVAYGACYYAYGVLIQPIGTDTHWPDAAVGAIFSAILVIAGVLGIVAGRVLDRRGPRPVFLFAAVTGTGAMLAASAQSSLLTFAIAYASGCGLVGALGFYHITQAAAARAAPAAPARAIVWLTIFGAFSSPGLSAADCLARRIGRVAGHDPDPGRHDPCRVRAGSRPGQKSRRVSAGPAR